MKFETKEYDFFSCIKCEYSTLNLKNSMHQVCNHPAVLALNIKAETLDEYTPEEYEKVNTVINDVLHLQLSLVDGKADNFAFPVKYEPVWITSCSGFKINTRLRGDDKRLYGEKASIPHITKRAKC